MSLIKMLSFAKSLRGERDVPSPFSVTQENLMPNFSRSGPRPVRVIAEEPIESGAGRERSSSGVTEPEAGGLQARPQEEQGKGKSMSEQQVVHQVGTGAAAGTAEIGGDRERSLRGRWLNNPFSPRPTLRADSKGQLSLEFLKVVRNDLSDADLELVPTRKSSQQPRLPAPIIAVDLTMEPEPSRWNRFTARLFGRATTSS